MSLSMIDIEVSKVVSEAIADTIYGTSYIYTRCQQCTTINWSPSFLRCLFLFLSSAPLVPSQPLSPLILSFCHQVRVRTAILGVPRLWNWYDLCYSLPLIHRLPLWKLIEPHAHIEILCKINPINWSLLNWQARRDSLHKPKLLLFLYFTTYN